MASGLTLIFGVMGIVNLAHAAFMTLAAYIALLAFKLYGLDPILSIPIVMPVDVPARRSWSTSCSSRARSATPRARGMTVLLTFALALVVEGVLGYLFTNIYRSTTPGYAATPSCSGPTTCPRRSSTRPCSAW